MSYFPVKKVGGRERKSNNDIGEIKYYATTEKKLRKFNSPKGLPRLLII